MRYVNGFFCVLLVLFAIVQYNDPDAILWILIYGVPAVWAGLAAFRPARFAHNSLLLSGVRRDPGGDGGRARSMIGRSRSPTGGTTRWCAKVSG